METIGFIGLGIMGAPMAGHLLDAGYSVVASDHRQACAGRSGRQGPEDCRPAMKPWRKPPTSSSSWCRTRRMWRRCCSATDGVAAGLSKGKLVIDMSSISPIATKEFAKKINALGCDYLDAPVSGGEVGAKAASLTIMVGGRRRRSSAREAGVREDGQEHHAGRRQRRRPDHQGGQPDRRRADHRSGRRSAGVCLESRRRSGQGAAGADGRLCVLAHPRSAWRAHGQAHFRTRASASSCTRRISTWRWRARSRSAFRCPTPRPPSNCSIPAPPMAAPREDIRRWSGRWRGWPGMRWESRN